MTPLPTTPSLRLDGKRALITGAGRGLGAAMAAALGQAGAHVVCAARTGAEVSEVAAAIEEQGGSAEALVLDVLDIKRVADIVAEHEPFDILVNNAGTNRPAAFVDVTPDDFDAILALNVRAAFFAAQAVVRRLLDAGRPGSIINVSSQMGHVGGTNRTVYCASKWAMEGMTKAMAIDLGAHGIRVNTLCPTFIETPLTRPFFENESFRADVLSKIKLGRLGQVQDIMGAVVFLASDAAAMMTGSAMLVDGGWTAG